PAHARLSGSLDPGVADSQAEGNAPGPGRIAAGGPGGGVECAPGESAIAVLVVMGANLLADCEDELDAAADEDDAEGGAVSCAAGCRCCRATGCGDVHRTGRAQEGPRATQSNAGGGAGAAGTRCRDGTSAECHRRDVRLSRVDRSAVACGTRQGSAQI